ncbi:MAG: DUF4416 family protein [bacterium]|uniref:GTP-binding protein n=2 Tax=Bacteria candidate phyla TaxID=1783234 RepID=A0A101I2V0_UNCT6|nr:MAG: hypothetical protein XD76_1103 [candidate division TA06 bacterium 32_111]KUK87223.1 MAG: hypothetical protein XE03_0831 [candidate division TA06 bacterium 34_109]MDI6700519.1 DUF4416 family protein [bacterium]HAF07393.1 DUF4416 domain-containing protein [candidate division WOR-3 bacterium]HCP16194.1 DUF4416 domain-containing protein [candidate division WOR-3 bacterium]
MEKSILFCGLLYSDRNIRYKVLSEIRDAFGEIRSFSKTLEFSKFSHYYDNEIGENITREWISFEETVSLESLFEKKRISIDIENRFKISGNRKINIDPGVITLNSVQLLTTKNYSHRVYLGEGIFCEVTFIFTKNGIKYLEWTYPDYKSDEAKNFFLKEREFLKNLRKEKR